MTVTSLKAFKHWGQAYDTLLLQLLLYIALPVTINIKWIITVFLLPVCLRLKMMSVPASQGQKEVHTSKWDLNEIYKIPSEMNWTWWSQWDDSKCCKCIIRRLPQASIGRTRHACLTVSSIPLNDQHADATRGSLRMCHRVLRHSNCEISTSP